ncbi:uncharacterized protein [Anoplolepis gracilipes]|uniref:uncharacterized protein n=1 Tax=Anoplolepis gracilipes TaxID=354296 RepID=UPI003BA1DEE2
MIYEIQGNLQMPYLRAIQAIPGDTASQKLSWIGKITSHRASGDTEQFPQELLAILQVETAVNEKNPEGITSALKSEDLTIVNRAFKATWFFDGSLKNIIDAEYFCKNVFPNIPMKTRVRIVSTLAERLTDEELAQQLFTKVASIYGICNAYPLIVACDEAFAYKTIEEQKLVLPVGIVKKIFRKNPNLIVRYLKLLKNTNANERASFPVSINKYKFILPQLVKKRLEAFVELFEMHESKPPKIKLSNTCAEIFLKKGQQYLIKNPHLYIDILPLKKINLELMQNIFVDLLPPKSSCFDTDSLLKYLEQYPQNERYKLLHKSYLEKYETELLDENQNVTPKLLQILPADERVRQARIKLEKEKLGEIPSNDYFDDTTYMKAWICYLPVNEAIPIIKEKISKTSNEDTRVNLICQMLYTCKVNEDNDALTDTLIYFQERHKNESSWVFQQVLSKLLLLYDVHQLNKSHYVLLCEIIKLFYIKHKHVMEDLVEATIHFSLIHNMPIDEQIGLLVNLSENQWYVNYNLLKGNPQYERKCLTTFIEMIEKNYSVLWRRNEESDDQKRRILCRLVVAMYNFNDRCKKSRTKIEHMTIENYPWLKNTLRSILKSKDTQSHFDENVRKILQINEPLFFSSFNSSEKRIADVTTGEALALLKRQPQDILDNWEKYLTDCKINYSVKQVQRFIRATRWYKDIPINFAERCMDYLHEKYEDMYSYLNILAILLHGDTMTELIKPLIPTETTIDVNHSESNENYKLVRHLPLIVKLSNPPISLEVISKLYKGDYLSIALMMLTNVSKRSCFQKVLSFSKELYSMRVGTRKHACRVLYQVAPLNILSEFLKDKWSSEDHHSVRQVIFETVQRLIFTTPNEDNWSLYESIIRSMLVKDEELLSKIKLSPSIPNQYVSKYFQIWLDAINALVDGKLDGAKVKKHLIELLEEMSTAPVCNVLSEDFSEDMIKKYLFIIDIDISKAARSFSMLYLFPEDENKLLERKEKFIDIFHNVLKKWNQPHPLKSRFLPYNNAVRLFMEDFVINYVKKFCYPKASTYTQFVDQMLYLFSYTLVPTHDSRSYLLLTYTKKLQESMLTNECFGFKLGQHMPELIKIFSTSLLVQYMAKILDYFLNTAFQHHDDLEEFKLSVIEGLIKADNMDSCLMAVTLLSPVTQKNLLTRYDELIVKFRKMRNVAVIIVLNDYQNMLDFKSDIFD